MKKKDYHHGNLKHELVQIAFDYIHEYDLESLTLKVLADATGTSRSAIYRHFKSKDELIEVMIDRGHDKLDNATVPTLKDKTKPLIERFHVYTKLYLLWAKENPNLYRLLFGKKYGEFSQSVMTFKDDTSGFGSLKLAIIEGQISGVCKKEDSYQQTLIIWASLHGLASLMIDGFMGVDEHIDKLHKNMLASLLDGVETNKVKLFSSMSNLINPKRED